MSGMILTPREHFAVGGLTSVTRPCPLVVVADSEVGEVAVAETYADVARTPPRTRVPYVMVLCDYQLCEVLREGEGELTIPFLLCHLR